MIFKDYIKTAFKNLRRRKARTFLTAFAVAIGSMLIITMVSIGIGARKVIVNTIKGNAALNILRVSEKYSKNGEDESTPLTEEYISKIEKLDGVGGINLSDSDYAEKIIIEGMEKKDVNIKGVDVNRGVFVKSEVEEFQVNNGKEKIIKYGESIENKSGEILIGEKFIEDAFENIAAEDLIGKKITIDKRGNLLDVAEGDVKSYEFTVRGIINGEFSDGDGIIISLEDLRKMQDTKIDGKEFPYKVILIVSVDDLDKVKDVEVKIKDMGFNVYSVTMILDVVNNMFKAVNTVLAAGGVIVLFVAALGVINTMTMAIYERTRSIGIMKALGASKRTIRNLFLAESAAIGLIGGIMGALFGVINTSILVFVGNIFLKENEMPQINLWDSMAGIVLGTIVFSIVVALLSGIYPAGKASKLDPIESLRHE